jgi:hypothetical protein
MLVPILLAFAGLVQGIGQSSCVSFSSSDSAFPVAYNGYTAPLYLSTDEWPGVQRAASDFAEDIARVTGLTPTAHNVTASNAPTGTTPIIIGTLGQSSLIDAVVNATKLDVSSIQGQWESFITKVVQNPLPGISTAYVIVGSDKRGTIYALYDLSEQFG